MKGHHSSWDESRLAIESRLGRPIANDVIRVEACSTGELVWTLKGARRPAWYIFGSGELRQVWPTQDERLPGAAALTGTIVSWRPGRRAVSLSSDGRVISKYFRRKRLAEALRRHRCLDDLRGAEGAWSIAQIESVTQETAVIHFERIEGGPVPIDPEHFATWQRAGAGLRAFQQAVPARTLEPHTRENELAGLVVQHQRVARVLGRRLEGFDRTFDRLRDLEQQVSAHEFVACHRDLHDGQFLVAGQSLYLLDFDQLCSGEPELDLGNLTAHFVLRALQDASPGSLDDSRRCALEALSGYRADSGNEFHDALRFYQATTFLRLALLYSLRPRWRDLVPALIHYGSVAADDLTHA